MKDKSLRKLAIASGKKIRRDIYFNKKRREELRKIFLESQKVILINSDPSIRPVLREEYDQRHLVTSVLAFAVTGLETIERAEEYDKKICLTNCRFTLFKKGKSLVFKATFLKPLLDKKRRTSYFYFPQGLPEKIKKKAFIFRDGKRISLKGYKEVDFGTFKQKVLDYKVLSLKYKGRKADYRFKLALIDEKSQSYWVTKLLPVKRS